MALPKAPRGSVTQNARRRDVLKKQLTAKRRATLVAYRRVRLSLYQSRAVMRFRRGSIVFYWQRNNQNRMKFMFRGRMRAIRFRNKATFTREMIKWIPMLRGYKSKLHEVYSHFYGADNNPNTTQNRQTQPSRPAQPNRPTRTPQLRARPNSYAIDRTKGIALIRMGRSNLTIKKLTKGIQLTMTNPTASTTIYYRNLRNLKIYLGKWLTHELGNNRRRIGYDIGRIWRGLRLRESTGRPARRRVLRQNRQRREQLRRTLGTTVLDLPRGKYEFNTQDNPVTYLLVRNSNTRAYYCLSFVQEAFDMMYGRGSARRIGLYNAQYARALSFRSAERYNARTHKKLPKGTIVRFTKGGSMTHIGIVLPSGRIGHIIGSRFYVDTPSNISEGWQIAQIIKPTGYTRKPIRPTLYSRRFGKDSSLPRVAYVVKNLFPKLAGRGTNLAYIAETIYQLNKDKFEPYRYRQGGQSKYSVRLISTTQLKFPAEWIR